MSRAYDIPTGKVAKFIVTGYYYNSNRRFKKMEYTSLMPALMINLWKGSVWALMEDGKRKLLKRVSN